MADQPNRVGEVRKRAKLSQQDLAEKVGAHWITISKLERGKMQLTGDWLRRLADALGTSMADLLPKQESLRREVVVEGEIMSDGTVSVLDGDMRDAVLLPADGHDDPHSYWLMCEGDALYPFFAEHDMIRFVWVGPDDYALGVGRMCHLQTMEGESLVGFLGDLTAKGLTLSTPTGRPRKGLRAKQLGIAVEAKWAVPSLTTDIAD
ncbi:helix-turn-helix domain-containing protein [Bosea lathyri]|uniref:Helix-turn-helix domain-containing protein n=1 Tax=Bosea lathyri TaxID=1036778 RepID=A0A1H6BKM8_9HYPH|nr:helix-turn-helix transcriptional regulator [Bosea lathyri]SEG61240.1 Helix-turn-helix domain-containing protein [Bosea lathyri]